MKPAYAVIGANYGDEGKGLVTDYLCNKIINETKTVPIVIRHNSGCQVSHTVFNGNSDQYHVFGHFGSGSYLGCPTYFGYKFVANPSLFCKEYDEISYIPLRLFMNEKCRITTPYDMLLNQLIELNRQCKQEHHGSCGVGFHETIRRHSENPKLRFCAKTMYTTSISDKKDILKEIYKYTIQQLVKEGVSSIPTPADTDNIRELKNEMTNLLNLLNDPESIDTKFLSDCERMFSVVNMVNYKESQALVNDNIVVFEGTQGLLLSMNNKEEFPHVTHCYTGLEDIIETLQIYDRPRTKRPLNVFYVTRACLTRHGNHQKFNAIPRDIILKPILEELELAENRSNKPNKFQGTMQYAEIWIMDIIDRLKKYTDEIQRKYRGKIHIDTVCTFSNFMDHLNFKDIVIRSEQLLTYISKGPKRYDIKKIGPIYSDNDKLLG